MKKKFYKNDVKDYFYDYLNITSSLLSKEYALSEKEKRFLVECCYFNYNGGNLSSMKDLKEYFIKIKFFTRKSDVPFYKYKLSLKKWIKSGRNEFILPYDLDIKKGEEHKMKFTINIEYKNEDI